MNDLPANWRPVPKGQRWIYALGYVAVLCAVIGAAACYAALRGV